MKLEGHTKEPRIAEACMSPKEKFAGGLSIWVIWIFEAHSLQLLESGGLWKLTPKDTKHTSGLITVRL